MLFFLKNTYLNIHRKNGSERIKNVQQTTIKQMKLVYKNQTKQTLKQGKLSSYQDSFVQYWDRPVDRIEISESDSET